MERNVRVGNGALSKCGNCRKFWGLSHSASSECNRAPLDPTQKETQKATYYFYPSDASLSIHPCFYLSRQVFPSLKSVAETDTEGPLLLSVSTYLTSTTVYLFRVPCRYPEGLYAGGDSYVPSRKPSQAAVARFLGFRLRESIPARPCAEGSCLLALIA